MSDFLLPDPIRRQVPLSQQSPRFAAAALQDATPPVLSVFLPHVDQPNWARRIAEYGRARFRREATTPRLSSVLTICNAGDGKGKRAVTWNYGLRFPDTYLIRQITGNCVEASNGDVGFTTMLAYAIFVLQAKFQWQGPGSSAFYMFRGHSGQGMDLGTAALAHERHGYAIRKVYCGGKYDLRETEADQRFGMENWRTQPADFLAETAKCKIGRVAELDYQSEAEAEQLCQDCLHAGGVLHTGSQSTASMDGDPVSSGGRIGPHAQTCVGYDDTVEFRDRYRAATGKTLTEAVYFFDQTHGPKQYVQKNWMSDLHGRQTQGMFVLPWSAAKRLILSTCYAYWPDLAGPPADPIVWQ